MSEGPSPGGGWRPGLAGSVAVDKPAGLTSHDVVARARRLLGERRIGHAGTLDPDATGVLVLGVGPATRLLRFCTGLAKSYLGEVVLGVETTTLDASGEVIAVHDLSAVTPEQVAAAAAGLTGRLLQVPPMVSAVHVGGRRLHELARAGVSVERHPRPVEVLAFRTFPTDSPDRYRVEVECSSGTYVRSLAADLGRALGGGAHLASLRRTAVGDFREGGLVVLDELVPDRVGPPELLVAHLARVGVGAELAAAVAHGAVLDPADLGAAGEGPWAVHDGSGALLAVYERHAGRAKPAVVLPGPPLGGGAGE